MAVETLANGIKLLLTTRAARRTRDGRTRRTRDGRVRRTRASEASNLTANGYEIHIGEFPNNPNKVVMIAETGGEPPNPKWLLDFPTIQTTIRGVPSTYELKWAEARIVKDLLLGIDSQTIHGDRWVAINLGSDLAYIGHDEKFRPMFSINFRLIIEPQASDQTQRLAL